MITYGLGTPVSVVGDQPMKQQREYSIRPVPGFGFAIVVDGRDEVALEDLDELAVELVKLVRAETQPATRTGFVLRLLVDQMRAVLREHENRNAWTRDELRLMRTWPGYIEAVIASISNADGGASASGRVTGIVPDPSGTLVALADKWTNEADAMRCAMQGNPVLLEACADDLRALISKAGGGASPRDGLAADTNLPAPPSAEDMNESFSVEVIRGVSGLCVTLNDRRIAGGKQWGGGEAIATLSTTRADVLDALRGGDERRAGNRKAGA